MKRIFAVLLALAIVFSMSITAFADTTTGDGKITITNATVGNEYAIYKIFDATYKTVTDENSGVTKTVVSYRIKPDNQFFEELFGEDGTAANAYFHYKAQTGEVTKKEGVNDTELINYLAEMVKKSDYEPTVEAVTAEDVTVEFNNIPYGYYVITTKDAEQKVQAAVTVDSNTPEVDVIDKNQKPGSLTKTVKGKNDANYSTSNSANIGDVVNYKIQFMATNYDGAHQIQYYQVNDEKGAAIWVDFLSIHVKVGEEELKKGWYLNLAGDSGESTWTTLGDWSGVEDANKNVNNADWFLVHLSDNQFRITIPWQKNHTLTQNDSDGTYKLTFPQNSESKFDSPVDVEITYDAAITTDATIGGGSNTNLFNKARTAWVCAHETHTSHESQVVTSVYGIGLLKDDAETFVNLEGAKFRLFKKDAEGKEQAVNLVPTKIDGVYMIDNQPIAEDKVNGSAYEKMKTPRELITKEKLDAYLGTNAGDNYAVSQVNGKLVILGLAADTYILREVEAPEGYNAMHTPIELELSSEKATTFKIFANDEGKVLDVQEATGAYKEHAYQVTDTTVHNSQGAELPSTGGKGTMMLITFGAVLAMGFAVLLITQKKMSIYKD